MVGLHWQWVGPTLQPSENPKSGQNMGRQNPSMWVFLWMTCTLQQARVISYLHYKCILKYGVNKHTSGYFWQIYPCASHKVGTSIASYLYSPASGGRQSVCVLLMSFLSTDTASDIWNYLRPPSFFKCHCTTWVFVSGKERDSLRKIVCGGGGGGVKKLKTQTQISVDNMVIFTL